MLVYLPKANGIMKDNMGAGTRADLDRANEFLKWMKSDEGRQRLAEYTAELKARHLLQQQLHFGIKASADRW